MSLSAVRDKINKIDDEMKALFDERMECSNQVASVKIAERDKVFKPLREKEIVERFSGDDEYIAFVKNVMQISRRRQYGIFLDQHIASTCDDEFEKIKNSIKKQGVLSLKVKGDNTSTKGLNVNDILSLIGDTALEVKNLTVSEDGFIDMTIMVCDNEKERQEALVLAYMLSEETIEFIA